MPIIRSISVAALLLLSTAPVGARDRSPEAQLTRALEGRTAGAPVDCLPLRDIRSSRIFDRIGILYETNNGTLYLNRPRAGARSLDWTDILVTDTHSPDLCSIDIVRLIDNTSQMPTGFVNLGKFVPYARPRRTPG